MQPLLNGLCKLAKLVSIAVLQLVLNHPVLAAWNQSANVRLTSEYESNPSMTAINPGEVTRTLLEPNYSLTGHFDQNEYRTGIAIQLLRSSNQQYSPDRQSPTAFLEWRQQQETSETGMYLRYTETETRDSGVDATVQAPVTSIRSSRTTGASWRQSISERTSVTAEGSHLITSYSGGNFIDYESRTGSLLGSYDWNERSTTYIKALYSDYLPADSENYSHLNSTAAGMRQAFSEQVTCSAEIGNALSNSNQAAFGSATVQYTGIRSSINIAVLRQASASGLGGFVKSDLATANWRYGLNERSSMGLDLSWQRSEPISQDQIAAQNGTRKSAGVWLQREINQEWIARTYIRRNTIINETLNEVSSDIIGLSFSYTRNDF